MKSRSMSIVLFILCLGVSLFAGRDFQLVEKWKHDAIMPSFLFDAVVDRDGDLLTAFQKAGVKIANAKKIVDLGPFGQGPGDLDGFFTLFFCKGDLAVEGTVGKLQLFHKQGGKYIWKQNIWKKRGASYQFVWDGQFMDGKWFFAGPSMEKRGENIVTLYYIKVYAEDGKFIKDLLEKKIKTSDLMPYLHLLFYYLEQYRGSLFFISENAPQVTIISPQTLTKKREVRLTMPAFYKPMPVTNYRSNAPLAINELQKNFETWKTNYSRICRIAIDGDRLVVQIRTCAKGLKRFALLFYNAATFKLEDTVFTNDLLLAVKDGNYYLFADGDPVFDEDAANYIINIYRF